MTISYENLFERVSDLIKEARKGGHRVPVLQVSSDVYLELLMQRDPAKHKVDIKSSDTRKGRFELDGITVEERHSLGMGSIFVAYPEEEGKQGGFLVSS